MVRVISAASQLKLDQNLGAEPAIIIEVQWVDGGSIYTYSDKDLGADEGKILEVSGLDNTVIVQGVQGGTSGDSQQISVTLDDTDGTIKTIIDSHDVHKESAWVYQWFQGLDTTEKFLIFKGQISSPMQWNEGDRTISFDIITRIEDAEVGFSIEEGDFEFVSEDLIGESWPLIFGTVITCPALRTRTPRKAILQTGFGILDPVLKLQLEQAKETCCSVRFVGFQTRYNQKGLFNWELLWRPVFELDKACLCTKAGIICEIEGKINVQSQFEFNTIEIIKGDFFPQDTFIVLNISGAHISGKFTGTEENPSTTFQIAKRLHPAQVAGTVTLPEIQKKDCVSRFELLNPEETEATNQRFVIGDDPTRWSKISQGTQRCIIDPDCGIALEVSGVQESWNYLAQFKQAGFFWAEPGAEVTLAGDDEIVYIANILPSTVHSVKAFRTFSTSNLRQLTTVPNTFYTVRQSDFNGYITTEIVFERPLTHLGEGWEDDILVTLTSSIGPNPVDIMEFLITKYTSFTWDSTFADIKIKVDNYPMGFLVPGRLNLFQLLQEIAFQGRMALVLRNDEFHLFYLPEEPIQDDTITETDVVQNSLVLDHTNTEDLVTKLIAEWRPECHLEDPFKVILRYNVNRYGTHEETFNFYTYNIQELVIKSATFWLIRMANTWRKIICKTPINKLALESLDGCFVTLPDIANGEIKCRVETATYNSDDQTIDFVLQTPVRSGERDAFPFHYPAGVSVELLYPTDDDLEFGNAGGSGPNVDVTPPESHVLGTPGTLPGGFSFAGERCDGFSGPILAGDQGCRADHGDNKPSDIDDTKPLIRLQEDNSEIPPSQSPRQEIINDSLQAQKNAFLQEGRNADLGSQITNNLATGTGSDSGAAAGGGAGTGDQTTGGDQTKEFLDSLPSTDDLRDQNKCFFTVTLNFILVTTVRIPVGESCSGTGVCDSPNGWCYCSDDQKLGCVVGNQVSTIAETFAFDTAAGRDKAATDFQEVADSKGTVGKIHPMFLTKEDIVPPGCEEGSGDDQMIGYDGTENIDGNGNERTIVGLQGAMTDNYQPSGACDF